MKIQRDKYLEKLIARRGNGLAKIITGVRRCGKSYLLDFLYREWLVNDGVPEDNIVSISLDDSANARYRNPLELEKLVRGICEDKSQYFYIFIDEIQMAGEVDNPWLPGDKISFVDVILSLIKLRNADIYVTGSNSRMLSSDIVTEFRDKGDEVKVSPLTFREYTTALAVADTQSLLTRYMRYGGLPRTLSFSSDEDRIAYLCELFENTYKKDVIERNGFEDEAEMLSDVAKVVASSVGSLVNSQKIASTFQSVKKQGVTYQRVSDYLDGFEKAFVFTEVARESIKGRHHIGAQYKYYFSDLGIRNAILSFNQIEENHLMENLIYNELVARGHSVSVGDLEYYTKNKEGKTQRIRYEIDFIAEKAGRRYYLQSAYMIPDEQKRLQETQGLVKIRDSFKKIVIVRDKIIPWHDGQGILYLGLEEFLLDESAMDR